MKSEEYKKELQKLHDYFNIHYPGWQKDKYVINKLKKTAREYMKKRGRK